MTYSSCENVETVGRWLTEFDRRSGPSDGFALGRPTVRRQAQLLPCSSGSLRSVLSASWDPLLVVDRSDCFDNYLLRHLLATDALTSVDAFEFYLAQMRGLPDLQLDPSIKAAVANLRGFPDVDFPLRGLVARNFLLPSPTWRRDDRPIIVPGITLEATPRKLVLPDPARGALTESGDDGARPMIVTIDAREQERPVGDAASLSSALAACLANDRAGSRPEVRRTPSFRKRGFLGIAAALATLAFISAAGFRPPTRAQSAKVVAAQPASATPIRVEPQSTHAGPPPRMTAERAPAMVPSRVDAKAPPPEKTLMQIPSEKLTIAAAVAGRVGNLRGAIGNVSQIAPTRGPRAQAVKPATIALAPVSRPLADKTASAMTHSMKADVSRVATHKPKKATVGKAVEVASALALPDVLKPH